MLWGLGWPRTPGDSPANTDLELFAGADKLLDVQVVEPDWVTPQDITGWTLAWTVHTPGDPDDIWLTKATGAGITLGNTRQGQLQIAVAAADTLGWRVAATLEWRLERTDAGADAVVARGMLFVLGRGA